MNPSIEKGFISPAIKEKFLDSCYEVKKRLGKGGFGNVVLLKDIVENTFYAGKIINSKNIVGTTTYYNSSKTNYSSKYERYKERKEMIKKERRRII